jgi:hypothetical protein
MGKPRVTWSVEITNILHRGVVRGKAVMYIINTSYGKWECWWLEKNGGWNMDVAWSWQRARIRVERKYNHEWN